MSAPIDESLFQWFIGIAITVIGGIVGWLTSWNFRMETKIAATSIVVAQIPTRQEIDSMLEKQTRQIVELMDARYGKRRD